jgi:2-methylcitrate dehydratase PrpD
VTPAMLTQLLAERGMGWRCGRDRFLIGANGEWIKTHQFQPLERVEHAFKLLRKLASEYSFTQTRDGHFVTTVTVGNISATASGTSEAGTAAVAIARALGIDVEDPPALRSG